ncbi:MAG TPA: M66 family metalloprotease [Polyangia bacterium]
MTEITVGAVVAAMILVACGGEGRVPDSTGATRPVPGAPGEVVGMNEAAKGDAGVVSPPPAGIDGPLVHGLAVDDVAIYQAVKVDLTKNGVPLTTLDVPLIANRPALLRVFVRPQMGWQPRPVRARLTLDSGRPAKEIIVSVGGLSTDDQLSSTVNFNLDAADVTTTFSWGVTLFEADVAARGSGSTAEARLPTDGSTAALKADNAGAALKITFVPIRYTGDGSEHLPDTSAAQLKFLTDAMFATYPVTRIDTTIRAPLDHPGVIDPMGNGWSSVLTDVCMARQTDRPGRDVFYYGLLAPGSSFRAYCGNACVSGIAALANNPNQDSMRCSIGIGFTNMGSGVFLQEVAHTMGRQHAPCGPVSQPDPAFPYQGARIGTWGYDLVHQKLVDPTRTVDFMSYCSPVWISDYTFKNLRDWLGVVDALAPPVSRAETGQTETIAPAWRVATLEADGSIIWGDVVRFDVGAGGVAGGVDRLVTLRDSSGSWAAAEPAIFFPHSTTGGGTLLLPPSTTSSAVSLSFDDEATPRPIIRRR